MTLGSRGDINHWTLFNSGVSLVQEDISTLSDSISRRTKQETKSNLNLFSVFNHTIDINTVRMLC